MTTCKTLHLSLSVAVDIASRELLRLCLAATYRMAAMYAGGDRRADGAAFAIVVIPNRSVGPTESEKSFPGLKLLIHDDGHTTLKRYRPKVPKRRHCSSDVKKR